MNTKLVVTALSLTVTCALFARGQTLEWTRQIGTSGIDAGVSVSADGLGHVYIVGHTSESLEATNAGERDAFLSKYDEDGTLVWTRQFGTTENDFGQGVSADRLGNVYISGYTYGTLVGTSAGEPDAFLSKYDAGGALQWTRQIGSSGRDLSRSLSADSHGNVFISGWTNGSLEGSSAGDWDAFLAKYDSSGALRWTRQLGTSSEERSFGTSTDGLGNVYISGITEGNLEGANAGERDVFLSKFDAGGFHQWSRQLGTSQDDYSFGVSSDGQANVYITGRTRGGLEGANGGDWDVILSKFNASGSHQWTRQLATNEVDQGRAVSTDSRGNVFITGYTEGSLTATNAGEVDAFLSKYDAGGTLQWTEQLGTISVDRSFGVSSDGLGAVYLTGYTEGSLGQLNSGNRDVLVAKFNENPSDPAPTVRTWEIEATVIDLDDPDNIFPDVRVGDPVRGFISYDLATPGEMDGRHDELFDHGYPFQAASMVIENPRGGSDLEFAPANTFARVWVTNDDYDEALGEFDEITIIQPVLPSAGFSGTGPAVTVDLSSPEAISSTSLPETLDLADWPLATISFLDVFDLNGSYLNAEIFSLTPIETAGMPGDFNGDGVVNAADYSVWRDGMGTTYTQADYDMWKANFGTITASSAMQVSTVPEPATWMMVCAMIPGAILIRSCATAGLSSSAARSSNYWLKQLFELAVPCGSLTRKRQQTEVSDESAMECGPS